MINFTPRVETGRIAKLNFVGKYSFLILTSSQTWQAFYRQTM
jgi:hypothetical protein